MNRSHFWKLLLILAVVGWSLYEMYPLTPRPLVTFFRDNSVNPDDTFKQIVEKAQATEKDHPDRSYQNLREAIGTNDVTHYFPYYENAATEADPTAYVLNRLQRDAAGKIKLGLDLQGGTSFLLHMQTNRLDMDTNHMVDPTEATKAALSQAVEVIRRRVDRFGVAEPVIQAQGSDHILVQLPGLSEAATESAKKQISQAAFLEFRMVHPESDALLREGTIPPGYEVMRVKDRKKDNDPKKAPEPPVLVKRKAERGFTGAYIKNAGIGRDAMGRAEIDFQLNSEGAKLFGEITSENIGQRLAIVLDGQLYSAPVINSEITERGTISSPGGFGDEEAIELSNVLQNPLKAPLEIVGSDAVDPTLGKDSIQSGIRASIYGVLAVALFMVAYYFIAGFVADVALILNIIILMGVMCYIGTTLTLPGIAGAVLTVGMAVDANVLIFERIREEMAKGKSLRGALKAGYDRAFGTIFDSHVTTLISSIILIFMGTGPIKGFGVTLTIGVAASLFTALVVTRLIFDWLIAKNILKSLPMLHIIRTTKLNFMRLAVPAFIASWIIIIAGNCYGIFGRGHDVLGVEFAGGDTITLGFDAQHKVELDKVRAIASKASASEAMPTYQRDISTGSETLRVTIRDFGTKKEGQVQDPAGKVVEELKTNFPEAKFTVKSSVHVGPVVGEQIRNTAIVASLFALFGILVYVAFRYEFSFAVGAVVAILHDVLMTLGCYFLAGRELNATTVAAVLTIIGFSINDTIVIFDRIREDLKLGVRGTFRELVNQALNQTLSRTIITSGTVFLATLSLFIFGGGPINDFAFTFLVGIITGTYSSIYIASALVLWLHKGQRPKIGSAQLAVETATPVRG